MTKLETTTIKNHISSYLPKTLEVVTRIKSKNNNNNIKNNNNNTKNNNNDISAITDPYLTKLWKISQLLQTRYWTNVGRFLGSTATTSTTSATTTITTTKTTFRRVLSSTETETSIWYYYLLHISGGLFSWVWQGFIPRVWLVCSCVAWRPSHGFTISSQTDIMANSMVRVSEKIRTISLPT